MSSDKTCTACGGTGKSQEIIYPRLFTLRIRVSGGTVVINTWDACKTTSEYGQQSQIDALKAKLETKED
jgi:hypothetical protein